MPYSVSCWTVIPNLNSVKYLGVILTDNLQDDEEIMKQTRNLYAHGNVLLRKFGLCSSEVKQQLFQLGLQASLKMRLDSSIPRLGLG